MNYINSYAHIKNNSVYVNGEEAFTYDKNATINTFLSEAYHAINIVYPKFHKMDALCKLGLLCAEFALQNNPFITEHDLQKTAIILSNSSSSLETDKLYQHSISDKNNYFPSPTIFVYTLPNIIIGELAIKHKITGENAFFITEKFDANLLVDYCEIILNNNATSAICGWVELNEDSYEAIIFLVEKKYHPDKNSIFKPLNQQIVTQIYNQT